MKQSIVRNISSNRNASATVQPFHRIPSAPGLPLIGTLWDIIKAGGVTCIHRYIDDRHRNLGPIFREQLGHVQAVWIKETDLYQQVYQQEGKYPQLMLPMPWLIFNEKHGQRRGIFFMQNEEWNHFRKILSPLLLKIPTLHRHLESLNTVADILIDKWTLCENGNIVSLENDLYTYFVQGLMCAAFGREVGLNSDVWKGYVPDMVNNLQTLFQYSARLTLFPPAIAAQFHLPVWNRFENAAKNALSIAQELTSLCMERLEQSYSEEALVMELHKQNVDKEDIQRIVADLFLAAADTTSHTMEWVFYLLGRHTKIQEDIVDEIRRTEASKMELGKDYWKDVPLMKGSVKEALRLFPVATFLTRILPRESIIGNYQVPAKTLILLSIYSSGRDERYFDRAEQFRPERWIRSENTLMDPYASLPFGHGKRSCIGRRLAESQMYLLLYKVLPKFHLKVNNEVEMVMRLLGTVSQPVQLRVTQRQQ